MSSSKEYQDSAETCFAQMRGALDSAAAKTALGQCQEALGFLNDIEHYVDMARRHLRLADEARMREIGPAR